MFLDEGSNLITEMYLDAQGEFMSPHYPIKLLSLEAVETWWPRWAGFALVYRNGSLLPRQSVQQSPNFEAEWDFGWCTGHLLPKLFCLSWPMWSWVWCCNLLGLWFWTISRTWSPTQRCGLGLHGHHDNHSSISNYFWPHSLGATHIGAFWSIRQVYLWETNKSWRTTDWGFSARTEQCQANMT